MTMTEILYYFLCALVVAAIMLTTLFALYPFIENICDKISARRNK